MNKSFLYGGILFVGLGVASIPYFMGKSIASNMESSIKDMNKSGMTLVETSEVGYLETISNGKIVINDGVAFTKNLSENHLDSIFKRSIENALSTIVGNDKNIFNMLLNGMEFEYQAVINNISTEVEVNAYISKFSNNINDGIKRQFSKKKYSAILEKIDSLIKDKKLAFTYKDNKLTIKDIKEEFIKNNNSMKINLVGLVFEKKDFGLNSFDLEFFRNNKPEAFTNIDNMKSNYDIKDAKNYKTNTNISKVTLFARNQFDIKIDNLDYNDLVETKNNKTNINFSIGIDKLDIKKRSLNTSINKTLLSVDANLNADGVNSIQNIDYSSNKRNTSQQLQTAINSIVMGNPKLQLNVNSTGVLINGRQVSTQLNANVDLKLSNVKSIQELQQSILMDKRNLFKFLDGSSFKIEADDAAAGFIAPLLQTQGIFPVKSKTQGLKEIVGKAENETLIINDRKMF